MPLKSSWHLGAVTIALLAFPVTVAPVLAQSPAGPPPVLVPAGRVPERIALTITGNPATPDFLAARIRAAVRDAIAPTLVPGSSARTTTILPQPEVLDSGFLTSFIVPVSIDPGAGAVSVSGSTIVDVQNLALPDVLPAELSFKDDPERITADGVLSRSTVDLGRPTRIYYYHENMHERRRFCLVLSANDSVMTHVQIVDAAAGPNLDVMSVGHAVTKAFLTLEPRSEGTVVALAGGKPQLERDALVDPGDGIVGALDLRVLDGGPVTVTVMAIPPGAQPASFLYAAKLPDDGHHRHGAFEISNYAQRVIAYSAGGRDVSYIYGSRQPTPGNIDPGDPGRDYGDYGVLQQVTFDLDNPTPSPVTLYLYERPLGGDVRSSFLVNGRLIEIGCARVPRRYLVAGYDLGPRATGVLDVRTMTDGGSNYPLEIGVSGTAPLAFTPAISAADGCFPKPGGPPAAAQPAGGPSGQ